MERGNLHQNWLSGSSLRLSCFWHLLAWSSGSVFAVVITSFREVEKQGEAGHGAADVCRGACAVV